MVSAQHFINEAPGLQSSAESRALSWAHLWVCPPLSAGHLLQTLQKQSCKNNQGLKSPRQPSFHSAAIWQALQEHDGKNWEIEEELLPSGHKAPKLSLITSTGLNLINCKIIHYSLSSALLLCVHTRYNLFCTFLLHIPVYINIY